VIDDFVLNQSDYAESAVLVSGPNFGSGSSREHAAWSLQDWGFEAVIAPSFGDIFYNNSVNIGLLPVVLEGDEVDRLQKLATDPANEVAIDLKTQTVVSGVFSATFTIDSHVKQRLLAGLDSIGETVMHEEAIAAYEAARPTFKPRLS